MGTLVPLAAAALTATAAPPSVAWWVVSPLEHVAAESSRGNNTVQIDIAAQRGEMESAQVVVQPSAVLEMDASVGVGPLPRGVTVDVFKVVHLYCNQSELYRLTGDRWIPDALVPLADLTGANDTSFTLDGGLAHSFWVRLAVGAAAAPGRYAMQVELKFAALPHISVPLALTVWDIDPLPGLLSPSSLGTIFAFNSTNSHRAGSIDSYYKEQSPASVRKNYMDALASERIPGDSCYLHAPREIEHYEQLAASGTRFMGLLDVSVAASNGSMRVNYTQAQIESVLAVLAPTVAQLKQRGLLDRAYVYGFDERPQSAELGC